MSNVRQLKIAKSQTYISALDEHIGILTDEEKDLTLQAGIIIMQTDKGLAHAVLSDTPIYTIIGILEAIKLDLISSMYKELD